MVDVILGDIVVVVVVTPPIDSGNTSDKGLMLAMVDVTITNSDGPGKVVGIVNGAGCSGVVGTGG